MADLSLEDASAFMDLLNPAAGGDAAAQRRLLDVYGQAVVTFGTLSMRILDARRYAEADERLIAHIRAVDAGFPTLEGACRHVSLMAGEDPDRRVECVDGTVVPLLETFAFGVRHALDFLGLGLVDDTGIGRSPVTPAERRSADRNAHPDDAAYAAHLHRDDTGIDRHFAAWGRAVNGGGADAMAAWLAEACVFLPRLVEAYEHLRLLQARRDRARLEADSVRTAAVPYAPGREELQAAARHVCLTLGEDPDEPVESGYLPLTRQSRHIFPARRAAEYVGIVRNLDNLRSWLPDLNPVDPMPSPL